MPRSPRQELLIKILEMYSNCKTIDKARALAYNFPKKDLAEEIPFLLLQKRDNAYHNQLIDELLLSIPLELLSFGMLLRIKKTKGIGQYHVITEMAFRLDIDPNGTIHDNSSCSTFLTDYISHHNKNVRHFAIELWLHGNSNGLSIYDIFTHLKHKNINISTRAQAEISNLDREAMDYDFLRRQSNSKINIVADTANILLLQYFPEKLDLYDIVVMSSTQHSFLKDLLKAEAIKRPIDNLDIDKLMVAYDNSLSIRNFKESLGRCTSGDFAQEIVNKILSRIPRSQWNWETLVACRIKYETMKGGYFHKLIDAMPKDNLRFKHLVPLLESSDPHCCKQAQDIITWRFPIFNLDRKDLEAHLNSQSLIVRKAAKDCLARVTLNKEDQALLSVLK
jgi:hypothetical protein